MKREYIVPGTAIPRRRVGIANHLRELRNNTDDTEWANEAYYLLQEMEEEISRLQEENDRRYWSSSN